ncbi:MAG TPA: NUDIX domain-containing protein [Methylomirabilota bacterium]|nr:NUDIX domain-containing protein [Methylomirabilota bacterium]
MIRNIIFDWSGTLVDDLPAVWQATNHVFSQAGLPEMTLEQFRAEFCLPFQRFYERHTPQVPLAQLEAWFHSRFKEVQHSVVELPHARSFLEFCRSRRMRMFLLSTVHRDHFRVQSRRTGFHEFLEHPYVEVWDKRAKIHEILNEHGLMPGETLFIGDMQHDVETARHGGIHSCAVLTGYNGVEQLRAARPDLIVEHLGELREILERNGLRLHPLPAERGEAPAGRHPVVTVGGLIWGPDGCVLMIRTHKWSNLWGIPGGKIKFGESSEEALRRELKEETNLDVADIRFVLVQDCIHSKEFYRDEHFVLLNYVCRCEGPAEVRLNDEAIEFRWVTVEEAFRLPLNRPTRVLLEAVASAPGRLGAQSG